MFGRKMFPQRILVRVVSSANLADVTANFRVSLRVSPKGSFAVKIFATRVAGVAVTFSLGSVQIRTWKIFAVTFVVSAVFRITF